MLLDKIKLPNRTLIPQEEGKWRIIVCGKRSRIAAKVQQLKKLANISEDKFVLGQRISLGAQSREKAAKIYTKIIRYFQRKGRPMTSPEEQERYEARKEEDSIFDWELLERLKAQGIPEEDIPLAVIMKDKWFLQEDPQWDNKTKALAESLRDDYEWFYMSPEEREKELKEAEKIEDQLRASGTVVIDSDDSEKGLIIT